MSDQQPAVMNGKPVVYIPAKSVLNMTSGFRHKLLCDGPTFTAGTACAFSCTYCYVPEMMKKSPHLAGIEKHEDVVIRRHGAIDALVQQLTHGRTKKPKYDDPNDRRVLYMSPLVDVAANPDLCEETIEACLAILTLTHWDIRILSKSVLLRRVAISLEQYRDRMIYGLSMGTIDPKLAACFEVGTSNVSARANTLHWLQDNGFRTFGMICPSLPQEDYWRFAFEMDAVIRGARCEHVWAEVMNARGESFQRTLAALNAGDYHKEAFLLNQVASDPVSWEEHSRQTFLAHAARYKPGQLRFLQYVTKDTRPWWEERVDRGAVLL